MFHSIGTDLLNYNRGQYGGSYRVEVPLAPSVFLGIAVPKMVANTTILQFFNSSGPTSQTRRLYDCSMHHRSLLWPHIEFNRSAPELCKRDRPPDHLHLLLLGEVEVRIKRGKLSRSETIDLRTEIQPKSLSQIIILFYLLRIARRII